MFGKNEIVGKKFFKDANDKLFITSMFMTLQGEGPLRGEPAFFVRFAKCNLACSFCDTYFDGGDWYNLDQLNSRIDKAISDFYIKNVDDDVPEWAEIHYRDGGRIAKKRQIALVVTGGEPMLQDNIVPFLERMNQQFAKTQIESNGIQYQPIPKETILVCSPKCVEKDGKAIRYLKPNDQVLARADCLKFVMCADANSPYSSVPEWALEWRQREKKPIYVSPMNIYNEEPQASKKLRATKNDITIEERSTVDEVISFWQEGLLDMKANQINHEYSAKYCVQYGCTLNLQIHLYASLA